MAEEDDGNSLPSVVTAEIAASNTADGATTLASTPTPKPHQELLRYPRFLSSFVDRERVTAEVADLVRGDHALVTLIGPGGVGKTRIATRVVELLVEDRAPLFPDGVVFVGLGSVPDATFVASAIAEAVGVDQTGALSTERALVQCLRPLRFLLVLDNFEHVHDAGALVAGLLRSCRSLTILATSRRPLSLTGEQLYPVEPLGLPDPAVASSKRSADDPGDAVTLVEASDAGRLFFERARSRDPWFSLTPENAAIVAAICRRLDGLPLAIELAAATINTLSPLAILDRLEPSLRLLSGGPRDQPARHQTMYSAIAWSYDLLRTEERTLFRRLGVFSGGWTLAAAEYVCSFDPSAGTTSSELSGDQSDETVPLPSHRTTLEILATLMEASLIRRESHDDRDLRFSMLETIRGFAVDRLVHSGDERAARDLHAAWIERHVAEAAPDLWGPNQAEVVALLRAELDNVRAALTWLLEAHADHTRAEQAVRIAISLWNIWSLQGQTREGQAWLERALACLGDRTCPERAAALLYLANSAFDVDELHRAETVYRQSLATWQELGDLKGTAAAFLGIGIVAEHRGDLDVAEAALAEAQRLSDAIEQPGNSAAARFYLGKVAVDRNDLRQASAFFREADAIWLIRHDNYNRAACCRELGRVHTQLGAFDDALAHLDEGISLVRSLGDQGLEAGLNDDLGRLAAARGDLRQAAARHRDAFFLRQDADDDEGTVAGIEAVAHLVCLLGDHASALRLYGAARAWRERIGEALQGFLGVQRARDVAVATASLGESATEVSAAARRVSIPEAATLALATAAGAAEQTQMQTALPTTAGDADRLERLTPRQQEILRLLATGLTDQEIADALFISRRTVTTHVSNVLAALGVRSRVGATAFAFRERLL